MTPRVFGIDYQFLSCGDVFTQGLVHAAADLGVDYAHADWSAPDLPKQVEAFAPDLLFVVHGRKFCQRHTDCGVRNTAVWLLDEPYEVDDTTTFSKHFDHVFINDPATIDRHAHASYLPVCYDPHVHHDRADGRSLGPDAAPASEGARPRAVGFIGGGNPTRDRYLAALARAGMLTYVVGGAWSDPALNAICLSRNLNPGATSALYRQTRIIVNVFRERHHFNTRGTPATALNPRVYEATACGALVISEWRPEVAARVPELPTFTSEAECVDIVGYFLAHPHEAEAIRVACMERLAPHTYAARLQGAMWIACEASE